MQFLHSTNSYKARDFFLKITKICRFYLELIITYHTFVFVSCSKPRTTQKWARMWGIKLCSTASSAPPDTSTCLNTSCSWVGAPTAFTECVCAWVSVINLMCLLHTGPAETHGRTETAVGRAVQESGGLSHRAHPDCWSHERWAHTNGYSTVGLKVT